MNEPIDKEIEEKATEIASECSHENCAVVCITFMKAKEALTTISQKTKKAYGNCDLCFGKGYSTQLENYSGRGESDIGQGGIEVRGQTPYYLPCSCDRGKQIKEMIEKAREEAEYTIHEVHGEGGRTVDGQTLYWAKVRKTLKDN